MIRHLLSMVPYEDVPAKALKLPPLDRRKYVRPPRDEQNFIPAWYV